MSSKSPLSRLLDGQSLMLCEPSKKNYVTVGKRNNVELYLTKSNDERDKSPRVKEMNEKLCESFEVLTATRGLLKIDHSDFLNDYRAFAQTKKSSESFTPYESLYVMDKYMEFKDMRNSREYSK